MDIKQFGLGVWSGLAAHTKEEHIAEYEKDCKKYKWYQNTLKWYDEWKDKVDIHVIVKEDEEWFELPEMISFTDVYEKISIIQDDELICIFMFKKC